MYRKEVWLGRTSPSQCLPCTHVFCYCLSYVAQLFEARRTLCQSHYNRCATIIQALWRGYFSRKHIHNFYLRKAYLHALTLKNEEVR